MTTDTDRERAQPYQSAADCPLGEAHGMASTHGNANDETCCDFCGFPVADEPLPLSDRERALVEAARAVALHLLTEQPGLWGNAPGHGHLVVGRWDRDPRNGEKGGTPCDWCAQWNTFLAALSQYEDKA